MQRDARLVGAREIGSEREATHLPVGILAFVLALGIAVLALRWGQGYAVDQARPYVHVVADQPLNVKWLSLTFQRAALADGRYLLMYGSSELYCCAEPFYATTVYSSMPTGFDVFAVGGLGSADLHNVEIFGALGDELRGRKLVVSVSPPYFAEPGGVSPDYYAGNFSPEIAESFVFSSVSLDLREETARRMRDYPDTLKDRPLLSAAVTLLADPSPIHLLAYDLLYPIGRLDAWVLQLQDARSTVEFIQQHPELRKDQVVPPPVFDWPALLEQATTIMYQRSTAEVKDPFGFPAGEYQRDQSEQPALMKGALQVFCSGKTNQNGQLFPFPTPWEKGMLDSAEWTDLDLEMRVLQEIGAEPLVYSLPFPGVFDDFTPISAPARQPYYQKFAAEMGHYPNIDWIDLRAHDEDRFFLTDVSAHFSTRGWIFINRALDMFWHGAPVGAIRSTLDQMNQQYPPDGAPPPSPEFCSSS